MNVTPELKDTFAENLRSLVARRGTVSDVAREIGINRTQFNRYLSGECLPAAEQLVQISRFFDVDERILTTPLAELVHRDALPDRVRVVWLAGEVERLTAALYAADWALMEVNGCFPPPYGGRVPYLLNKACTMVRAVTGDDYAKRQEGARKALGQDSLP